MSIFMMIMAVLVALVGCIGLTGTMSLNVMERTAEIDILRAIGASNRNVMKNVLHATADAVVTGEDVNHGKPDPEVYLKAIEKLGCENLNEVLVFEDSEVGIKAAEAAGLSNIIKVTL